MTNLNIKKNQQKRLVLSLATEYVNKNKFKQFLSENSTNEYTVGLVFKSSYFLVKQLKSMKAKGMKSQKKSKTEQQISIKKLYKQSKAIFQTLMQNIPIQSFFYLIQSFLLQKQGNDNFGKLYDQALFQLNHYLYQIIQKLNFSLNEQLFQQMKKFIEINYLPIFESNKLDAFEVRLIQVFLNITSEMLQPLSNQLSLAPTDKNLFIQTIPSSLVGILKTSGNPKSSFSYSIIHRRLLSINTIVTLTNYLKYFSHHTLQFCNPLIDGIIQLFQQSKQEPINVTLVEASFRCLIQIIQSTKNFVSGKLTLIFEFLINSYKFETSNKLKSELIQNIVRQMALRICIKPLFKTYGKILQSIQVSEDSNQLKLKIPTQLTIYLELVHNLIRYSKDKQILASKNKLGQLLAIILSFRKDINESLSDDYIQNQAILEPVQFKINEAIIQFFMKLKQSDLKTVIVDFIKEEKEFDQINFKLSFWSMMIHALQNIKSFAVPFFSYCIDRVVQQLHQLNSRNQKNLGHRKFKKIKEDNNNTIKSIGISSSQLPLVSDHLLMKNLLRYVSLNFKYDSKGVIQMTWFQMLIQPISDVFFRFKIKNFVDLADQFLIPCVQQMFEGYDEDNDKQREFLNQILMKIRENNSPQQRLGVARCIYTLIKNLKDKMMIFLRDIVPFITELQEDQDESIIKQAQKSVYEIEKLTGESLKDYM